MSIEISRRNFLKATAASLILEGGALTGCDSSKDNDTKNPQFVKHGKDDAFTFNDGTKVVFYDIKKPCRGKSSPIMQSLSHLLRQTMQPLLFILSILLLM